MNTNRLTALIKENMITIVPRSRGNKGAVRVVADFGERDISDKSMRKIKRVATNWGLVLRYALRNKARGLRIKPQFVFLTLTLASPQQHSDVMIKRVVFQPLLAEIARANGCPINYIWRCESQANGNIHFHVILDRYVDRIWIRAIWNRLQDRLGYVERSELTNPPSTYIELVNSPENVAEYCAKYMCKSKSGYRGCAGKLWGCSTDLKELDCALRVEVDANWAESTTTEAIEQGMEVVSLNEWVSIILLGQRKLELFVGALIFNQFWDNVGLQYLKVAHIFESYRYVNFSLS